MERWLVLLVAGGIAGAVFALGIALVVVVLAFALPRPKCPDCGEPFPRFRKPAKRRQTMWGGGTCAKCGCEIDRRGKKIESP